MAVLRASMRSKFGCAFQHAQLIVDVSSNPMGRKARLSSNPLVVSVCVCGPRCASCCRERRRCV
eukprot:5250472-Alexandrium_andersonii.AAC.1